MPRICTICAHEQRAAVEAALVGNEPLRNIAARFETSPASLSRHKVNCIPTALAKAQDAVVPVCGDSLLERINELAADARRIQERAERAGDLRCALAAVRELRCIVEMLAAMRPSEQPIILHFGAGDLNL
jgi:hypothetical protein